MKKFQNKFFYHFYKTLFGLGLRIYYKKITVSGPDKIPLDKPIITASNHPTGLMDVFLASHHIKRQIRFTAAGTLFKDKLQAAFLTSVGTIPVYRRKDSPGEQDKNVESFVHCFTELESDGAVGFYPEGTSHPEPWVNPIKTGVARVALQAEERNNFELNLLIIPVGINSTHPGKFRGSVFVNIGDPIAIKKYQTVYQRNPVEAANNLTTQIQEGMEACNFHIQDDSLMNIFDALKTVGVKEIKLPGKKVKSQAEKIFKIIKVLQKKVHSRIKGEKEQRSQSSIGLDSISQEFIDLKQKMQTIGISGHPFHGIKTVFKFIAGFIVFIMGLPFIIPAVLINILPFMLSKNLGQKLAGKDVSLIPAGRLMIGTVIFLLFYLLLFIILAVLIGFLKAVVICVFLLAGGYLILWYSEVLNVFLNAFRKIALRLTKRDELDNLIEKRSFLLKRLNDILISIIAQ